MIRSELPEHWDSLRTELASRVRQIRIELYGEHGGPMLASALDLPFRIWSDYERGGAIPADVMLRFLEHTGAEPRWLLTGKGPKFTATA
jgi:hypothetical protein